MIEELVSRVFSARDAAHVAHLRSKSYSQHMALGSFYEDVIDALDDIVEVWQGNNGLMKEVITKPRNQDILSILIEDVKWIETNRDAIAGKVRAIENLIDSLSETYFRTIYKLKNLK